jgi:hypothetical protein
MTGRHLQVRCGLLGLAILLGGCVYSVESLITDSSAAFDARLLGDWKEVGGSEHAVVTRSARNGYTIEYGSDDSVSRYAARLGRLGNRLILDVSVPPEDSSPTASGQLPIAWHVVYALDVGEREIRVAPIEGDSLAAAIRAGRIRLDAHARSAFCPGMCAPTDLILDGTTEELRATLGPYLERAGSLEPPNVFLRAPRARNAAPPPPTHAGSSTK